ncbi:MAG: hypothetical protein VKO00_10720 [Cyanobacteriota bacterium]|nr:hypothetical protein [Cyanobacteriota bacterium]
MPGIKFSIGIAAVAAIIAVLIVSLFETFSGIPYALLFFVGFMLGIWAWGLAANTVIYPRPSEGVGKRIFIIVVSLAFASFARAVVGWGGLQTSVPVK